MTNKNTKRKTKICSPHMRFENIIEETKDGSCKNHIYNFHNMIFPTYSSFEKYAHSIKYCDYTVYVFSTNPELTKEKLTCLDLSDVKFCTFNPFNYIRENNADADIMQLSNMLLSPFRPFDRADSGHEESGKRFNVFLSALISYLYNYTEKELQKLEYVMLLIRMSHIDEYEDSEFSDLDRLFRKVEKDLECGVEDAPFPIRQYKSYKLNSPNIQKYIAASVAAFLSEFDIGNKTDIPCQDNVPFLELTTSGLIFKKEEKANLIIVVDIDKDIYPCTNTVFWNIANKLIGSRCPIDHIEKSEYAAFDFLEKTVYFKKIVPEKINIGE